MIYSASERASVPLVETTSSSSQSLMLDQEEIQEHRLLYTDLNAENKKRLCQKLIKRILLFEDGTVQIIPKRIR